MTTPRPGNRELVRVRRAIPKLRGGADWSATERKSRALAEHLRVTRGWKPHSIAVLREWEVRLGQKPRRLSALGMSMDREGWVFSVTIDPPAKGARDGLRSWMRELHARLGDGWRLESYGTRPPYLVRVVRKWLPIGGVLAELDAIVTGIEGRAPRPAKPMPRGDTILALVGLCRSRGWLLESIGYEQRRRIRGCTRIALAKAISQGNKKRSWFFTMVHFELAVDTDPRGAAPPDEARALRARGYRTTDDTFFLRGTALDVKAAKREIAAFGGGELTSRGPGAPPR